MWYFLNYILFFSIKTQMARFYFFSENMNGIDKFYPYRWDTTMSWLVSTNIYTALAVLSFVIACLYRQISTSIYDKITPPTLHTLLHHTTTIGVSVHTLNLHWGVSG